MIVIPGPLLGGSYSGGTAVTLAVGQQPLQPGLHRFTAFSSSLVDLDSDPLDGNRDGTGGDDFVTEFEVTNQLGSTIESTSNNAREDADRLDMIEDPADPSADAYQHGFGLGTLDTSSDVDYWWFEALAADRVAVSVSTPGSDLNPRVQLRNSADATLADDYDSGPDGDSLIQYYEITSSGRYHPRVFSQSGGGEYELRVDLGRGQTQIETDAGYANDGLSGADPLPKYLDGQDVVATVAGNIMAAEGSNTDEDVFALGQLNAGNGVVLALRLPSDSGLDGRVVLLDTNGQTVADNDGNPNDSTFSATLSESGAYYARVEANEGAGSRGIYLLDVALDDDVSPQVVAVSGLPQAGESTDLLPGRFSVTFDEDLGPNTLAAAGALELRGLAPDGDTSDTDDVVFALTFWDEYVRGETVSFTTTDGEMIPGVYRLTVSGAITDIAGNTLDGDGNSFGGDDFVHEFSVTPPDDVGVVFEDEDNAGTSSATPLKLVQDGGLGTSWHAIGLGTIEHSDDQDYWRFEAQAGDRVLVYTRSHGVDTRRSNKDTQTLRGEDDAGGMVPPGLKAVCLRSVFVLFVLAYRGDGRSLKITRQEDGQKGRPDSSITNIATLLIARPRRQAESPGCNAPMGGAPVGSS